MSDVQRGDCDHSLIPIGLYRLKPLSMDCSGRRAAKTAAEMGQRKKSDPSPRALLGQLGQLSALIQSVLVASGK